MRHAQLDGANHLSAPCPVGFANIDPLQSVHGKATGEHFVDLAEFQTGGQRFSPLFDRSRANRVEWNSQASTSVRTFEA